MTNSFQPDESIVRWPMLYATIEDMPTAVAYGIGPAWVGTMLYWSDGAIWSIVGGGGLALKSTNTAAQNTEKIQAALNKGGLVCLYAAPGCTLLIDDTLIIPSQTKLQVSPAITMKGSSSDHRVMLRLGNIAHTGSRTSGWNFQPICHSPVSAESIGTVKLVKSGGNWGLSYMGPGDSTYGTTVTITASQKVTLSAPGGAKFYGRFNVYTLADGTYTQNVKAIPTVMPPKSATVTRTVGVTKTAYGSFSDSSRTISSLSQAVKPGDTIVATGYCAPNTKINWTDGRRSDAGIAVMETPATNSGYVEFTITKYNVVTVSEIDHNRHANDYIMVLNSANGFEGLFKIHKIINKDTYTYRDCGSYIGSDTVTIFGNTDIGIEFGAGARIESDEHDAQTTIDSYMAFFHLTSRLTIKSGTWKNLTGKYCGCIQGVSNLNIENVEFDSTASDGFTCQGSLYNALFKNNHGRSVSDNLFGIGTAIEDVTGIQSCDDLGSNGIDNVIVDGLTFVEQEYEPIRLFGSRNCTIDNVLIRNLCGSMRNNGSNISSPGVGFLQDTVTPNIVGTEYASYGSISIEYANIQIDPGSYCNPISISGASSSRTLFIDNLKIIGASHKFDGNGTSFSQIASLLSISKAVINSIIMLDPDVKAQSGNSSENLVNIFSSKLYHLEIRGGCSFGLTDLVRYSIDNEQSANIIIDGVYLFNCGRVLTMANSNVPRSLAINNCHGDVYNGQLVEHSGSNPGAMCAISYQNNTLGTNALSLGTGGNFRANGDIEVDAAKLTPAKGDCFYNNNAAYGTGVGVYVTGTSSTVKLIS